MHTINIHQENIGVLLLRREIRHILHNVRQMDIQPHHANHLVVMETRPRDRYNHALGRRVFDWQMEAGLASGQPLERVREVAHEGGQGL